MRIDPLGRPGRALFRLGAFFLLAAVSCSDPPREPETAAVRPLHLRCEYRSDPLGLDQRHPRLSWIVASDERGQIQSAYRILVASSLDRLTPDRADLWDSGRVRSDRSIQVEYQGTPLGSRMECVWQVRLWDREGRPSAWSAPGRWTTALLEEKDWTARWIGPPGPWPRRSHITLGYRSRPAPRADTQHTIEVDLGRSWRIDGLRLLPTCVWDAARGRWGPWCPLYPVRFALDVSDTPDFEAARTVFETAADLPAPTDAPGSVEELTRFRFPPVTARYARLRVTRLRGDDRGRFGLTLGDLQLLHDEVNVAVGARVKASRSHEDPAAGWSASFVVDGVHAMKAVGHDPVLLPPPVFRKTFTVDRTARRAVLYATALGVYEFRLNGRRVGNRILAPEWTDPDQIVHYQTYDVTPLLQPGRNTLQALVGDGWQRGVRGFFGGPVRLLAQLEMELGNGTRLEIVTDDSWQVTGEGPVRYADIFQGEFQDLRRDLAGWKPAHVFASGPRRLTAQADEPLRILRTVAPVEMTEPRPGVFLFDMGENMVGWCRLRTRGPAGTEVRIRHSERLNPGPETPLVWKAEQKRRDDLLYTANLVGARQEDRYVLGGPEVRVLEPHFTSHGFRYVEVTGLATRPARGDLVGCVLSADLPRTGTFTCSCPMLNRLMANILRTQRGNLCTGVQTDCPQRNERLGWLGDAQVFSTTACMNLDMAAFLGKWCRHIRLAQSVDGLYADTVPSPQLPPMASAGWGDAGLILPWRAYVFYADRRLLADHYASARKWLAWFEARNPDGLRRTGFHSPGDWLNGETLVLKGDAARPGRLEGWPALPMSTDRVLFATAYHAHAADLLAAMARALGRRDDVRHYRILATRIRATFQEAFVLEDGRVRGDTQGGYGLALAFDLVPAGLRRKSLDHLVASLEATGGRLSTGIVTTPLVLEALTAGGRVDMAYRALFQRRPPSWAYMIEQGATTIWERWDGFVAGRGFQDPGMNSFNHCGFGAVGGWIYRTVLGMQPSPDGPGWKHFTIRPRPGGGLAWARGSYRSLHGTVAVDWRIEGDTLHLTVTVPTGTKATIHVPAAEVSSVEESGRPLAGRRWLQVAGHRDEAVVLEAASGTYRFVSRGVRFPAPEEDRRPGNNRSGR